MSLEEEIIEKIIESTGVKKKIAKYAFEINASNIEAAIQYIKNKVFIISGKGIISYDNIYCLFIIKIFQHDKSIIPFFLFCRDDQILNTDIKRKYYETEVLLMEKSYFVDHMLQDLSATIARIFKRSNEFSELLNGITDDNFYEQLESKLDSAIKNIFQQKVDIELFYYETYKECISRAEYDFYIKTNDIDAVPTEKEKYSGIKNETSENSEITNTKVVDSQNVQLNNNRKMSNELLIKCDLILSQSTNKKYAKPVEELLIGDEIYLLPVQTGAQINYIFNILSLNKKRISGNSVKSKIVNIEKIDKDSRLITAELIPGVNSKHRAANNEIVKINECLTSINFSSIIYLFILFALIIIIGFIFIYYLQNK